MVQNNFMIRLLRQFIFFLILPGTYASAVSTLDLPDIGESTGNILSPEYERRLG